MAKVKTAKGTIYDPDELNAQAKDLQAEFAKYATELSGALARGVEGATLFVEGEAKKLSPVDTGLLRTSITHATRQEANRVDGYVGTATEYGVFQELGTSRQKAANNGKGFLTPALNENKTKISAIIARSLKEELK